jgi:RNA polymerase sigma-70 factor (ECF subfamily)
LNSDEINERAAALCDEARQGDLAAASELLALFYERIFVWLCRLCGNHSEAEDLTQKAFCKVWESLAQYEGRCSVSTWIHRIAYHTYVDWRRQQHGKLAHPSEEWWQTCEAPEPNPLEDAMDRDLARFLYAAVERLDEALRPAVYLHYYDGLSISETAEVLEVATSTVKYRLREAMRILKSHLKEPSTPRKGTEHER